MGGRGMKAPNNNQQTTFQNYVLKLQIEEIRRQHEYSRELNLSSDDSYTGVVSSTGNSVCSRKKCVCCGQFTLPAHSEYEVCPVCGWIDDPYQNQHPTSLKGMNSISLQDARQHYTNEHLYLNLGHDVQS